MFYWLNAINEKINWLTDKQIDNFCEPTKKDMEKIGDSQFRASFVRELRATF